jgi:DNA-binding response OmpR family regulator
VSRLLIITAQETEAIAGLRSELSRDGFSCSVVFRGNGLMEHITAHRPDLVMVEMDGNLVNSRIQKLAQT